MYWFLALALEMTGRQALQRHQSDEQTPLSPIYKVVKTVYASPSRVNFHLDARKEVETTPAYPDICFAVDDFDSTFDEVDLEEETEEEIDKVLTTIAGETAAQLPEAAIKEKLKQPAQSVEDAEMPNEIHGILFSNVQPVSGGAYQSAPRDEESFLREVVTPATFMDVCLLLFRVQMESFWAEFEPKVRLLRDQLGIFCGYWKSMCIGYFPFLSSCQFWGYGYIISTGSWWMFPKCGFHGLTFRDHLSDPGSIKIYRWN